MTRRGSSCHERVDRMFRGSANINVAFVDIEYQGRSAHHLFSGPLPDNVRSNVPYVTLVSERGTSKHSFFFLRIALAKPARDLVHPHLIFVSSPSSPLLLPSALLTCLDPTNPSKTEPYHLLDSFCFKYMSHGHERPLPVLCSW